MEWIIALIVAAYLVTGLRRALSFDAWMVKNHPNEVPRSVFWRLFSVAVVALLWPVVQRS